MVEDLALGGSFRGVPYTLKEVHSQRALGHDYATNLGGMKSSFLIVREATKGTCKAFQTELAICVMPVSP